MHLQAVIFVAPFYYSLTHLHVARIKPSDLPQFAIHSEIVDS